MAPEFSARDFVLGLVAGVVIAVSLLLLGALSILRSSSTSSLSHWKLNLRTPMSSMWINLGFWKTHAGDAIVHFDEATRALLEQIVDSAGLLANSDAARGTRESVAVLDLGFGCGDQTIALMEMIQAHERPRFRYVGLTLDAAQVQVARRSLDRAMKQGSTAVAGDVTHDSVKLFCANAAKPDTWSKVVRTSVIGLADEGFSQRWLLALDCLYHFSPSRRPAFKLASKTLGANIMAFDLLLDAKATNWNIFLVRLVGLVMSCPLHTFLTEEQYRKQLSECGYDGTQAEIREISDHVFAGVAGYLRRQETALSHYGISFGGFKLAGRLFEWFDRTRVVKAVIVVARTKTKA